MIVQQFVGVLRDRPSWNDALVTLRNDVRAGMALREAVDLWIAVATLFPGMSVEKLVGGMREAADAYDALHAGGRSELAGSE